MSHISYSLPCHPLSFGRSAAPYIPRDKPLPHVATSLCPLVLTPLGPRGQGRLWINFTIRTSSLGMNDTPHCTPEAGRSTPNPGATCHSSLRSRLTSAGGLAQPRKGPWATGLPSEKELEAKSGWQSQHCCLSLPSSGARRSP